MDHNRVCTRAGISYLEIQKHLGEVGCLNFRPMSLRLDQTGFSINFKAQVIYSKDYLLRVEL